MSFSFVFLSFLCDLSVFSSILIPGCPPCIFYFLHIHFTSTQSTLLFAAPSWPLFFVPPTFLAISTTKEDPYWIIVLAIRLQFDSVIAFIHRGFWTSDLASPAFAFPLGVRYDFPESFSDFGPDRFARIRGLTFIYHCYLHFHVHSNDWFVALLW